MMSIRKTAINILAAALCIMLIVYADISVSAAANAVDRCVNILIPSLFVFLAASNILIRSKAYKILSLPFYPIAKYVFKIPYELFSVLLISNLAGFPVGASMLVELTKQNIIDKKTASLLQCVCYGGGPSFAVGVIGIYLYSDIRVGLIICLSAFLANITAALIICRALKPKIKGNDKKRPFTCEELIVSTENAGRSMLMICAMVIIFSVILACVERLICLYVHIPLQAKTLLKSVFEISSIASLENARIAFVPVISALFGFGGVCVLLQIIATVKGIYSLTPFFVTRLPIALINYLYARLLCSHLIDDAQYCMAVGKGFTVKFNNFIPSLCLILMIFLLLFKKGVAFFDDM